MSRYGDGKERMAHDSGEGKGIHDEPMRSLSTPA
jgi:hypothetical protein